MSRGWSTHACRPAVLGSRCMISTGHYLATAVGARILALGGNAIDAGVAAGIAVNVVQPAMTYLGGVAPILISHAPTRQVVSLSGVGWWPRSATLDAVARRGAGGIHDPVVRGSADVPRVFSAE